ncbi:MAG TPA: hypothetical protein VIM02_04420 [Rhizomicrobium sp.]
MSSNAPIKPYGPANRCIYCGATQYSKDEPNRPLGEEHIIPRALGAELTILLATCQKCDNAINKFESYCLNYMFAPIRAQLGIRTGTGKRAKFIRTKIDYDTKPSARVKVPVEKHPTALVLPRFHYPEALAGFPTGDGKTMGILEHRPVVSDFGQRLRALHPGKVYSAQRVDTRAFRLLLAKIGHSFAMAQFLNEPTFKPLLTSWIRGINPDTEGLAFYVGSSQSEEPKLERLYELNLKSETNPHGRKLAVVRIRLFGHAGFPSHYVVAGEW